MKKVYMLFWGLMLAVIQSYAASINVSPATIEAAMGNAMDGDVLLLEAGTYSSGINFQSDKVLTLKAAEDGDVTITQQISMGDALTNCGLRFEGVTIDRGSDYFMSGNIGDITELAFTNVTIQNVNRCFLRTGNAGFSIGAITFDQCIIKDCGNNGWNFIYTKHIVNSISITNTTLYNYLNGESFFYPQTTDSSNDFTFAFTNNTVYKWGKDSSRALCNVRNLYSTNSNYIFSDNIIAEPGSTTLPNIIVATGGTLSAENNLVVNYGSYNITSATSSSITDNSLETLGLTEIGFVNADGGDFTILSTSPIATASTTGGIIGDPRWLKQLTNVVELTILLSDDAAGEVSPTSGTYNDGDEITLTATNNFGYEFVEWQVGNTGTVLSSENPYTFIIDGDISIKAVYNAKTTYSFNVEVSGSNWGEVSLSPEPTEGKYEDGTIVTMTAESNTVANFLNWEDYTTELSRTVLVDGDKNYSASFDEVPFIVGWDFAEKDPTSDRSADYFSATDNTGMFTVVKNDGSTTGWLARTSSSFSPGYACAQFWASTSEFATPRAYQTSFSTVGYENIQVNSMLSGSYHGYSVMTIQYSLDGTTYTQLGTVDLTSVWGASWADLNVTLPDDAEGQAKVYVRWIADTSSAEIGNATDVDGTAITNVFVFADQVVVNDQTAPTLISTIPTEGATNASANGSIVLTFDEPVMAGAGNCTIGSTVLSPSFGSKTVTFSYTKLEYDTEYTFTVPDGALTDKSGNSFSGLTLSFSTMNRPQPIARLYDAVVAKDGSGDYTTIQEAIDGAPSNQTSPWLIFVKKGTYNELVRIPEDKPYMYLIGQDKENTIISFAICCSASETDSGWDFRKELWGMSDCAVVVVSAGDFYAENISFVNDYGVDYQNGPMALAMRSNNDRFTFNNCNFKSFQDTWYTTNGLNDRHYAYNCYIEGAVDYIYGSGDVFIDQCTLYNMRSGSVIVAPAHVNGTKYGYVFNSCTIDGNEGAADGNLKLGRPWHNEPIAVYLNTKMNILPAVEGWTNMGVIPKLFAEYNSMDSNGNAIDLSNRKTTYTESVGEGGETVSGLQAVLSQEEAAQYTYDNVLSGNDSWNPRMYFEPVEKPAGLSINNNILDWNLSDYAICYVVYRNGEVIGFTTEPSYTDLDAEPGVSYTYSVCAANEYGSLSELSEEITNDVSLSVSDSNEAQVFVNIYDSVLHIDNLKGASVISVYSLSGNLISIEKTMDRSYSKKLDLHGLYIVKVNSEVFKVSF